MVLCNQPFIFDGYERLLTDSYYTNVRELFVRDFIRRDFKRLHYFFLYLPSCFYRLFFKLRRYGFVTEKLLRP